MKTWKAGIQEGKETEENIMCKYCEEYDGEMETHYDEYLESRAYLQEYDTSGWTLTISDGDNVTEHSAEFCPWCGRELL